MATERVALSDLVAEVIDNRGRSCPVVGRGIPLIATNCVRDDSLYPTYDKVRYVSAETYATWFRAHPRPGDILFVNKATPGRVAMAPDPVDFCIAQDMVALRAHPSRIYPKYLFAALRSRDVRDQIDRMQVGTMIPHFKKGDFDKLMIPMPSRAEQRRVGDMYFTYSAKIDVNRRVSETLEEMSRALFKSWFVDFDPARAKAEGRDTGLPPHIADLFPDRLVSSELGEIPEGWMWRRLPEVATFLNGLALQKYPAERGEVSLPVIKIAQLRALAAGGADRASALVPNEYIIEEGDLLFSWSGSLLVDYWTGGTGALNQHLFKVTPLGGHELAFIRQGLLLHLDRFRAIAAHKATTMGHIKRGDLNDALVAVPPDATAISLQARIATLDAKILALRSQSRSVAVSRDELMRKLIG